MRGILIAHFEGNLFYQELPAFQHDTSLFKLVIIQVCRHILAVDIAESLFEDLTRKVYFSGDFRKVSRFVQIIYKKLSGTPDFTLGIGVD